MKKRKNRWFVTIIVIVILAIGVPIGINEAYKADCGYITVWGAADVLSYYGTLLGTTATVIAFVVTISYTSKQIRRDSYLKKENEKWERIEVTIGSMLNEINPTLILKQLIETGVTDPPKAINLFQKYQISCRIVTDQLITYVNVTDYAKIEELVNRIIDVADKLFRISQKEVEQYNKQIQLKRREIALQLLSIEKLSSGSLSVEEVVKYQDIIKNTDDICFEDIEEMIQQLNEEFVRIYDTDFRSLLQLKGATFEMINEQTLKTADAILSLRK